MNPVNLRRPPSLRRGWLFVPGMNQQVQQAAIASGADVIVADLEEFTTAAERPVARSRIISMLQACHRQQVIGGVRINKLADCGRDDLDVVMQGAPDLIFLPHAETAEQMVALDQEISLREQQQGLLPGETEIVPTIESARGLLALGSILRASPRIKACMLAVEDLADDFGAERGPDGMELLHARGRFLIECIAAGCQAIDLPCTFRAPEALAQDLTLSRRLGFKSKCVVFLEHVAPLNRSLTPTEEDIHAAQALCARYDAQSRCLPVAPAHWIDAPLRNNAQRLLLRHQALAEYEQDRRTGGKT